MNTLRVLYSFPLRFGTPGIGRTAWYQVSGLVHKGVHMTLYCGSCEKLVQGLDGLGQTLVPFGIKIPIRLLGLDRAAALHDKIVSKAIRAISKKSHIDIVHCWPSSALETLKTCRELRIKTVLERPSAHTRFVYEITANECNKLGIKLKKGHYSVFNERRLAREEEEFATADKLLCPSEFVVKTFLEKGFSEEHILRHKRGYDPEYFSLGEQPACDNDNRPFTILYVGECNPLKGLHFALQAWAASNASKKGCFYICGKFLPEYRNVLSPLLANPNIKHLGFIKNVASIMRQCDVLVLPSLSEGFGVVACEARACGCVLLVSDAASGACVHMINGLIHKAGDVDTLREHIDLLASNKDLLLRLRTNSLATISDFTWDKASERLLAAYYECLSGKEIQEKQENP